MTKIHPINKPILTFSFLVFIFLCKLSVLSAQFSKNGALYASTEYRINPFPGEENESTANKNIFMLEYIHKDSKSIIIEYSNDNTTSLNSIFTQLPSDLMYQSFGNKELDSLAAFGSFSDAYSGQNLIKTASIMFGKVNYLNQKRILRANMSAGIGISTNNKHEQWKRRDNTEG